MNGELVSIVMATYNGRKYLRQQLDSILEQTHPCFELIVVDDASTDGTLTILHEYAALDDRIQIFPAKKNLGLIANFERGLRLAKGDFIALADQDDIFRNDKIELLLAALQDQPQRDLVVSDLSLIDEENDEITPSMWSYQKLNPKQSKPFRRLIYSNFATGCALMFRRRLLEIALPFPPDCRVHDWWLAVVSASSKGGGICLVSEPLTAYRQHSANVIGANAAISIYMTIKHVVYLIVSLIKARHQEISNFERRIKLLKPEVGRLEGYLLRDFWTLNERRLIQKLIDTYEGYLSDAHSSLLSRMIKLPQRVRWAATAGDISRCVEAVDATIWPCK